MSFVNTGVGDRLVSASAEVAASVELHEMKLEGDVMKMRQVDGIELGGGLTTELKPGGFHVMLVGLKGPLVEGASFPMKLKFEKAGEVTVEVKIEAPGTAHGAKH
jgi:copper(I)-binding protein